MKEILLSQLDRENTRLNHAGDELLTIKVDNYDLHNYMIYLDLVIEFDSIADSLSGVHQAVLECFDNTSLLKHCTGFISNISLMVCNFIVKVTEFKENMSWRNN